jgi:hypothetical protein
MEDVIIKNYYSLYEAEVAKKILKEKGIESVIQVGDRSANGFKLFVLKENAQKAIGILKNAEKIIKEDFVPLRKRLEMKNGVILLVIFILLLCFVPKISDFISNNQRKNDNKIISPPVNQTQNQKETDGTPTVSLLDWETYRNEEYGIEFQYPVDWGTIVFQSKKNNEVYIFDYQNETSTAIFYHEPSGELAFIAKGEKYSLAYGGQDYQDILKVIFPDKKIKTIYTIPPETVSWYGNIANINFSPDGKYVYFGITFYEGYDSMMINIDSGINIIESYNIILNPYRDVYWSSDNKVLVIRSEHDDFGGGGVAGLFISDYDNPEKLNKVFFSTQDKRFSGSDIGNINFDGNNNLLFTFSSKKCELATIECQSEKIIKYKYGILTKELEEIK